MLLSWFGIVESLCVSLYMCLRIWEREYVCIRLFVFVHVFAGLNAALNRCDEIIYTPGLGVFERQKFRCKEYTLVSQKVAMASFCGPQ